MAYPFTFNRSSLSEASKAFAETELRETPENVRSALQELRTLLRSDVSIHFKDDDETLLVFLRPCKFYAKSAYELMKRFAQFKEKNCHLLKNLLPKDVKDSIIDHNIVNILTNRDQQNRRILIINFGGDWDTLQVSCDQVFQIFYLIHNALFLEPETQVRGAIVLLDFRNLSWKQIAGFTPACNLRLLCFIQEASLLRIKEVHIVNQPVIFHILWQIFKPLIRKKLKSRIHIHGTNMKSLHKFVHPVYLPKNYGGQKPAITYTSTHWYPCLAGNKEHFKMWNHFGIVKNFSRVK